MSEPQGHYGYEPSQPNPYVRQPVNPYDQPPPAAYYPQQLPYGYPPALPDHPQSVAVFVLGLISFFVGGLTAPFALVMGRNARREISGSPGRYKDGGLLTAGWVMGIIGTAYLGLMILIVIAYVAFFAFAFSMMGSIP